MRSSNIDNPTLSLCLIARDSARTLPACLASIRPWVDEMVVVDTGSVDGTPTIARSYGARVFRFPWCDDFSAARNESLRHTLGRWLFWMDSDDTIDEANGRRLRELAHGTHADSTYGYIMQVVCPGDGSTGAHDCTVVDHVKMFRNAPELRFEGRIHEQILPAIRRCGGEVEWTDIRVVHSGSDQSPDGRKRKQERDLRILQREFAERPKHPFTLFNLGMTYADAGDHQAAIEFLKRSLQESGPHDSHLRKAHSLLVHSLIQLDEFEAAKAACRHALRQFAEDPELLFRYATICHAARQLAEAEQTYKRLIDFQGERHLSSVDPTITGYKARQNLAAVYHDQGRHGLAELEWRHVLRLVPEYPAGWRGLVESQLRNRRFAAANLEIGQMLSVPKLRVSGLLLRARLHELQHELEDARRDIQTAVEEESSGCDALEERCRFLFEHGELAEAHGSIVELSLRRPEDGAVFHNLGAVRMRLGEIPGAIEAYRRSLELRPRSPDTRRELASALHAVGRASEAAELLEQATEHDRVLCFPRTESEFEVLGRNA